MPKENTDALGESKTAAIDKGGPLDLFLGLEQNLDQDQGRQGGEGALRQIWLAIFCDRPQVPKRELPGP